MAAFPVNFQSLKKRHGSAKQSKQTYTRAGSERRTHQASCTSACLFSLFNGLIGLHSLDKYFPAAGTELVNQSQREMFREIERERNRCGGSIFLWRLQGAWVHFGFCFPNSLSTRSVPVSVRMCVFYVCLCVCKHVAFSWAAKAPYMSRKLIGLADVNTIRQSEMSKSGWFVRGKKAHPCRNVDWDKGKKDGSSKCITRVEIYRSPEPQVKNDVEVLFHYFNLTH